LLQSSCSDNHPNYAVFVTTLQTLYAKGPNNLSKHSCLRGYCSRDSILSRLRLAFDPSMVQALNANQPDVSGWLAMPTLTTEASYQNEHWFPISSSVFRVANSTCGCSVGALKQVRRSIKEFGLGTAFNAGSTASYSLTGKRSKVPAGVASSCP
jgi:hypothetical protein